jgi:hypothetical protein
LDVGFVGGDRRHRHGVKRIWPAPQRAALGCRLAFRRSGIGTVALCDHQDRGPQDFLQDRIPVNSVVH